MINAGFLKWFMGLSKYHSILPAMMQECLRATLQMDATEFFNKHELNYRGQRRREYAIVLC